MTQIGPHRIQYVGRQRFVEVAREGYTEKKYAGSDLLITRFESFHTPISLEVLQQAGFTGMGLKWTAISFLHMTDPKDMIHMAMGVELSFDC